MSPTLKKILIFLLLTFGIDWSMVFLYLAFGGQWTGTNPLILAVVYMFVPMLSAIIVQKAIFKEPVVKPLGISFTVNRWFFVAWLLPPVIAFSTLGVSLLFPGVTFAPDMSGYLNTLSRTFSPEQMQQAKQQLAAMPISPIWIILLEALIAGTTVNAIAGFGEELGWRGFLLRQLKVMGFWKSSALIGVIWGLWHAPLILQGHNYPQHPQIGVLVMIGWTVLLAPLFSYIRIKARSVIAASIFHGTINAVPGIAILLVSGGDDLTVGITGAAGFVVLAIANLGIFIFDRFITKEPVNAILKDL
jgi:membrane protease YdiL (CAAX protease family)